MKKKTYGLGVIVGRFQILHKGHGEIIRAALEKCGTLVLLIGSSQEQGSYKNPFSYEQRKEYILKAFPDVRVYPLPDIGVGNCRAWGDYVLDKVTEYCGRRPDVFLTGTEERRESWFGDEVEEITLPKTIEISSSRMKEYLLADDRESFEKYIEPALRCEYETMRGAVMEAKDQLQSESI